MVSGTRHLEPMVVPGNKTYADAVQSMQRVLVASESTCNGVRYGDFSRHLQGASPTFKCFNGATSDDLHHYVDQDLKVCAPGAVIGHVGCNDLSLSSHRTNEEISTAIIDIGLK